MNRDAMSFLRRLVETPSPSGYEQRAQKLIRARMKDAADEVRTDVHGNVMGILNPDASIRVMLSGHCDEIGLMVVYVDNDGFLYIAAIGGIDPVVLAGQRVEIHSEKDTVQGVIGRKPIHLMKPAERIKPTMNLQQFWIDIGAKNRKDALRAVSIGDPVTIHRKFCELRNGLVAARGFDDRVGAWSIVETLRKLKNIKLNCALYAVSTVQEELGLRGARTAAFGIDPHVGIAIDVGFASDFPGADKKLIGETAIGKGPILHRGPNINPRLAVLMEKAARKRRIPFQMQGEPRATGTDANVMQVSRAGVATALVSVPNRYMHTPVEIVSLKDLDNTVSILVATVRELGPSTRLIP